MAKNKKKSDNLPLALKLKAWWEGYDTGEVAARFTALSKARAASRPAAPKGPEKPKLDVTQAPAVETPSHRGETEAELEKIAWTKDRVDVAQYIWGPGYCGPGGPEHVIAISKLLNLSPEMSVIEIGAELGGRCRALADKYGAWMTGYEESEALAVAGNEMSHMAGMERKAPIRHYNPDETTEFDRKYDRALAKEALYTMRDKANVVNAVFNCLKPDSMFLITDYVIGQEGSVSKQAYREWKACEHNRPKPVLAEELVNIVKSAGFVVRVSEDLTFQYIDMISNVWKGADEVVAKLLANNEGHLVDTLLEEAEFWNRRIRLMKSGDLKVWRVLGYKRTNPNAKLMSDW